MKPVILMLTCANEKEADKISQTLLEKRLVVCIKKFPVSSSFLWKGKIDSAEEVLLIMDSIEEKFRQIEKEIRKIHSYNTFVLISVPVIQSSTGIKDWMKESIK